jgi:hypothetical protein
MINWGIFGVSTRGTGMVDLQQEWEYRLVGKHIPVRHFPLCSAPYAISSISLIETVQSLSSSDLPEVNRIIRYGIVTMDYVGDR